MSQEEFEEMVSATVEARNFQKQKAFDVKVQKKKVEKSKNSQLAREMEMPYQKN